MSKVLGFMKQVARGLQMEGNFGTAHVYRSSRNPFSHRLFIK